MTIAYSGAQTVFSSTALDGLASSGSLVGGYESNVITNIYDDVLLSGRFKVNNTAPSAGVIYVYVGSLLNDTEYPDVFDGTASAETVTSTDIRNSILVLAHSIITDTTANRVYEFRRRSVAALFDGVMPPKWFVFISQATGQNLNETSGQGGQVWYTPVNFT